MRRAMANKDMPSPNKQAAHMLAAAADLLEQGRSLNRLSAAVTAIAVGVMLVPDFAGSAPITLLVVLAGVVELFFASRVRFDGRMFARLATEAADDRLDLAAFDAALSALRLMPEGQVDRRIAERFLAARRLLFLQVAALGAQMAIAVLGGIFYYVSFVP
jgi:hypothetical protein